MTGEFNGKGVIVTGAGSGIGRATALAFAEEGANLVLVDINEEANRESLQLVGDGGAGAVTVNCDLSREDQVKAMVDSAVKTLGEIHIAVNNAGVEQEVMHPGGADRGNLRQDHGHERQRRVAVHEARTKAHAA